jgi:hypothetical protein
VNAIIRDVTGRLITTVTDAKQIDVRALANGTYMLFITDERGTLLKTEKLIKSGE